MGCGACVPTCPEKALTMTDVRQQGLRPVVDSEKCKTCGECLNVCPGIEITDHSSEPAPIAELSQSWGNVLEVWEGYAQDSEIRYKSSSGGAVTALALYCLENKEASNVLHIGSSPENPLQNTVFLSKSRQELIARIGSRYSPAAPCEKLDWICDNRESCVLIGKPCDIVALRKSQKQNEQLCEKINLSISIFCAGTPATEGTYNILEKLKVNAEQVEKFRYRGYGWPGMTDVKVKGSEDGTKQLSYQQSWGEILSKYTQFRCRLCPDSTGQLADISCGDPWYRQIGDDEKGFSLLLVRTERGREILHRAAENGYLKLERTTWDTVPRSQKALLERRRHLWGRLLMLRLMGIPVPRYTGFDLFNNWLELGLTEKIRSFCGTFKRIIIRQWTKPIKALSSRDLSRTTALKK